jgi:uncharacterized 2Fe-2S/4Fe-4S cluster protein (DUF4445 family)
MKKQNKFKIELLSHHKSITAKTGDNLADKIQESGINLNSYCSKKGVCGKCFVEICSGLLPPLKEKEAVFLKQKKWGDNFRLACLYKIEDDLKIRIPEKSIVRETFILKTGVKLPIRVDPPVKKFFSQLQKPDVHTPLSSLDLIKKYFRNKTLNIHPHLLKDLPEVLEKNNYNVTSVLYGNREIVNIEPGNTLKKNYGIAIDIGTTTIVVELVNLDSGKIIDSKSTANSQAKYGADVVSRITFAYFSPENRTKLKNLILERLNQSIQSLLESHNISADNVYEIVVAGNTAMNHLLLGLPVKSLALSPFSGVFSTLPPLSAHELGFTINRFGKVYISPNIKSFVGGDISAGLTASEFAAQEGNLLFIDLGTNGEIVLKVKNKLYATSTAAGPAFEGMNISCGMLAVPGAIYKVTKPFKLYTIKDKPAAGICGTGLIDLTALFLREKKITTEGRIADKSKKISVSRDIYITQKDIREMQLAVAAIKTGIRMMLQKQRLEFHQLDGILIAGAFGNYLNIKNSIKIGLLPPVEEKKITFIGNSALSGARSLLLSEKTRKKCESLIGKIEYVSLAANKKFQDIFIKSLQF